MQQHEMQLLIEQYLAAYNKFDVQKMIALLHENVIFENYSETTLTHSSNGVGQFRELAEKAAALFTERKQSIKAVTFEPNGSVSVTIDYYAQLATDLSNEFKAGDTLKLKGKSVFRFQDNLISYIADYS